MPKLLPSQTYLRECFVYDPDTGEVWWKTRPRSHFEHMSPRRIDAVWKTLNRRFAGEPITFVGSDGYLTVNFIRIGPRHLHRIIWKIITGDDVPELDHRDTNKLNNRWGNLRSATRSQNQMNRTINRGRRGLKGATKHANANGYFARYQKNGVTIYLGSFGTEAEAHGAYCEAARNTFGEFFNPG